MSLNKFMHPRNIYRTPPDFKQLAIEFAEFRNVSKMSINGNVHIDFQNGTALRTLTKCLLKKDFNIDVTLPETNLIPTLSLRLNYILWLEDVLQTLGLTTNVSGIDIGCGASCIYPLLAVRQNPSWRMFATEINAESMACAVGNVDQNHLSDSIQLIEADASDEPFDALNRCDKFETAVFSMCNPPFFNDENHTSEGELVEIAFKNRTGKRKSANNVKSGTGTELVTSGGEIAFVKRMIHSSRSFSERIQVFTTMLGHKCSVATIQSELNAQHICNYCTTEFCQGRTMRWAIAWTFRRDLLLRLVPKYGPAATRKILRHAVASDIGFDSVAQKLFTLLSELEHSVVDRKRVESNRCEFHFVAEQNSWSKQRQKKRAAAMKRMEQDETANDDVAVPAEKRRKMNETTRSAPSNGQLNVEPPPHLHVLVSIEREVFSGSKNSMEINLEFLNGCGGIDAAYQLLQFIKNKWKELPKLP